MMTQMVSTQSMTHPHLQENHGNNVINSKLAGDEECQPQRVLGDPGMPSQKDIAEHEAGGHAIDWGVYGVPETYVIGADGRVLRKHVGEIDAEFEREVLQAIRDQQETS